MKQPIETEAFVELAPGIRRLTAPNPGMMTGPGTNTYLVGVEQVAVIDPGPMISSHLQQIADLGNVRWIVTTHTHPDHSPGANRLAELTGAERIGRRAPEGPHQDMAYAPDHEPQHRDVLEGDDFRLHMLHTPGHASNHFCYLHEDARLLFTGDHIMNGSTVVIDPPDGDMADYLDSLAELKSEPFDAIAPGHGPVFDNPTEVIDDLIAHRLGREKKVYDAMVANPGLTSMELVPHVYQDVSESLYTLAERSLLAHLIKLEKDGRASQRDNTWQQA